MTLQQFINFDQYVRCFTFGKMDILPVHYDPKERKYHVDHKYLSSELGARVVKDAQTINQALGYEMNTIEFAVQDGVPYAIDFLNPAPDFERDRITEFYFEQVVERMARLVIDRALRGDATNSWPRWEVMVSTGKEGVGFAGPVGFTGAPVAVGSNAGASSGTGPTLSGPSTGTATSAAVAGQGSSTAGTSTSASPKAPPPAKK
jgi:hypothetical protein